MGCDSTGEQVVKFCEFMSRKVKALRRSSLETGNRKLSLRLPLANHGSLTLFTYFLQFNDTPFCASSLECRDFRFPDV